MQDSWWKIRIALICQPAGIVISYLIAFLRSFDQVPHSVRIGIGVGMGLVMALLFIRIFDRQARDYELARSGDREAILSRLEGRFLEPSGLFWLLLAIGSNDGAERVLNERLKMLRVDRRTRALYAGALDLARRGASGAEALVDAIASCPGGRLPDWNPVDRARARLHALLLATAGTMTSSRRVSEKALAHLAGGPRDAEIEAYAAWLRAHLDAPIEGEESPEASERAAELAAKAGYEAAAKAARIRAARIRASRAGLAYR